MAFHHIVGNSEPYNAQKWHEYDQYTRQIIQGHEFYSFYGYDMTWMSSFEISLYQMLIY